MCSCFLTLPPSPSLSPLQTDRLPYIPNPDGPRHPYWGIKPYSSYSTRSYTLNMQLYGLHTFPDLFSPTLDWCVKQMRHALPRVPCVEMHNWVCSCTVLGKREEGVVFMWVALPQDCSVLHWSSSPISLSCSLIWHPASCCSAHRAGNSVGGVRRGVCGHPPTHPHDTRNWTCWSATSQICIFPLFSFFFFIQL